MECRHRRWPGCRRSWFAKRSRFKERGLSDTFNFFFRHNGITALCKDTEIADGTLTVSGEVHQVRLQELRKKIVEGLDSLDRGDWVDGEEFFERLRQREEKLRPESR